MDLKGFSSENDGKAQASLERVYAADTKTNKVELSKLSAKTNYEMQCRD